MAVIKTQIDAETAQRYLEVILPELTEPEYTAYGVHTVLNRILVANGAEEVRPQMMYNYARNGLLVKGVKISGTSLRKVTAAEAAEFLIRYCYRNGIEVKFGQPTNPDQLELDLESVTE